MAQLRYIFVLTFLTIVASLSAQDIHFSHIHASPLTLNPAMAGVFEGDFRLIANYRNQWKSVTADYKTFMASADANFRGFNQNSILGIGGQVYSDVAGDLDFTTTSASVSISVMQAFDRDRSHILAGGIQIGRISNRFDASKIMAHDPEPIAQLGNSNQLSYFDVALGLLWFKRFKNKESIYLGGAMYHVNNPVVTFNNDVEDNSLYRRFVAHGGANVHLNDYYTLSPNFIYMQQGPHQEVTLGTFAKFQHPLKKREQKAALMLGGWVRSFSLKNRISVDALVAAIRVDYGPMIFTFTYDVNVSTLARASTGRGGPEISLVYIVGSEMSNKHKKAPSERPQKKKSKMKCPAF